LQGERRRGAEVGGTIVALIIAPIVLAVVAIVVGFVFTVTHVIFTVIRPEVIGFFGACLGGALGVTAARSACDAVLRHYAPRVVFVELVLMCLVGLVGELVYLPLEWARAAPVAQLVVIIMSAYGLFWTVRVGEPAR